MSRTVIRTIVVNWPRISKADTTDFADSEPIKLPRNPPAKKPPTMATTTKVQVLSLSPLVGANSRFSCRKLRIDFRVDGEMRQRRNARAISKNTETNKPKVAKKPSTGSASRTPPIQPKMIQIAKETPN